MNIQQGFLLTRQARDIKGQTQIELWLATEAGPTQLLNNGEKPVFFIAQEHIEQTQNLALSKSIQVEIRTLELKTFEHTPLAACYTKVTLAVKGHCVLIFTKDDMASKLSVAKLLGMMLWGAGF